MSNSKTWKYCTYCGHAIYTVTARECQKCNGGQRPVTDRIDVTFKQGQACKYKRLMIHARTNNMTEDQLLWKILTHYAESVNVD